MNWNHVIKRAGVLIMASCISAISLGGTGINGPAATGRKQEGRIVMPYRIENGDTVYQASIRTAYIFYVDKKRNKGKEWREYYRLVWNFNKVYPYALKAKVLLREADSTIEASGMTGAKREKYLKEFEKRLFREFEKPIRNLTFSQGRLLMRLIERECGLSSYYIINNYRGKLAAGFWQGIAKLFGADLKKPYDRFGEDKDVEELVRMYQDGSFQLLYKSIFG